RGVLEDLAVTALEVLEDWVGAAAAVEEDELPEDGWLKVCPVPVVWSKIPAASVNNVKFPPVKEFPIVSVSAAELLALKSPSPPYSAVMACMPTVRCTVMIAWPFARALTARIRVLSRKVIMPVGVPLLGAVA